MARRLIPTGPQRSKRTGPGGSRRSGEPGADRGSWSPPTSAAVFPGPPSQDLWTWGRVCAALRTLYATRSCLRDLKIKTSTFHHGIYIPQGIVAEVARQEGVRVAVWTVAYRTGCFIGSHDDTYHHTLMTEPVEAWQDML